MRTSLAICFGVSLEAGAVSLACLGDSCGLGTQLSRNAALNGHNGRCCAASTPRDSVCWPHTSNKPELCCPGLPGARLSDSFQVLYEAQPGAPPKPAGVFCKRRLIWEQKKRLKRGLGAQAKLPLLCTAVQRLFSVSHPRCQSLPCRRVLRARREERLGERRFPQALGPGFIPLLVALFCVRFYILTRECKKSNPKALARTAEISQPGAYRPHHCAGFIPASPSVFGKRASRSLCWMGPWGRSPRSGLRCSKDVVLIPH